jgi:hypothetical protein
LEVDERGDRANPDVGLLLAGDARDVEPKCNVSQLGKCNGSWAGRDIDAVRI